MGRFLASVVLVHVRSDTRHFVEIGPCSFRSMVRAVEGLLEVSAVDVVIDDLADMHVDGSLDLHDVVELDCELVGFADAYKTPLPKPRSLRAQGPPQDAGGGGGWGGE